MVYMPSAEQNITNNNVLSVTQVVQLLRDVLSHAFPALWFRGELGPVSRASSGHVYFTIKDPAASSPNMLNGVMWKGVAQSLPFAPTEGLLVECQGVPTIYPASGRLQLVVSTMRVAGDGALRMRFEQLRARLGQEGLFAPERKRPLPLFPLCIGVVTSRTGSVIHDIAVTIRARMPGTLILLAHAKVQGDGASDEIIRGIRQLNEDPRVEVLIVARGGGSLEDLWAFNEEATVRAIFGSKKPVISAVGHETDITLADLVADMRAPTPTGAGRIVVPDRGELLERIRSQERRFGAVEVRLRNAEQRLDAGVFRLKQSWQRTVGRCRLKVAECELKIDRCRPALRLQRIRERCFALEVLLKRTLSQLVLSRRSSIERSELLMNRAYVNRLAAARVLMDRQQARVHRATLQTLTSTGASIDSLATRLRAIDPAQVLARGFAIVAIQDTGGGRSKVILDAEGVESGTELSITMRDGGINATVKRVSGR
jgi:exodeoxyribonuclease VII large subunit